MGCGEARPSVPPQEMDREPRSLSTEDSTPTGNS